MKDFSLQLIGLYAVVVLFASFTVAPGVARAAQVFVECQNSLSDAANINAAIAGSDEGDEIIFQGECLINQVIELLPRRAYRGESRTGTVLKQAPGANLTAILASSSYLDDSEWTGVPISIRSLKVDGNKGANTESETNGIVLRNWLSVVEDVQVSSMGGHGILLTNLGSGGTPLSNTQVNGQINGNFITGSEKHGIFVEDSGNSNTDWQLMNNWIANSGWDGIHLDNAAGWMIERNHIYGVGGHAIYANRLWGTSIADNYIEGFGDSDTSGTYGGIVATVQGGLTSTIFANRISGALSNPESTYRFIDVSVNYGTGVIVVAGNVIRPRSNADPSLGTGLYYEAGSEKTLVITSTGNLVYGLDTPKTVAGNVVEEPGV